jgi:hypothetical protein
MKLFTPEMHRISDIETYNRKISKIPLRIIVEGTRGKSSTVRMLEECIRKAGYSTLAKTTGEDPELIYNGEIISIFREHDTILLDYDNIPSILNYDVDALVIENQAITPYTMRYVHKIIRPQHVIIPNIRIDHIEGLGNDLVEMTENFTKNLLVTPDRKEVYYTEPISKVHDMVFPVIEEFAEKHDDLVRLHDIEVPRRHRRLPGIENICVCAYFMKHNFDIPVNTEELFRRIHQKLTIKTNEKGINYFNASKINDPISFIHMLSYILDRTEEGVALIGYLRHDRAGRNEIFEDFLDEIAEKFGNRIERIWLAGYGTEHLYERLPESLKEVAEYNVRTDDIPDILDFVREHHLTAIPIINRVNEFMDELLRRLENPDYTGERGKYQFNQITGLSKVGETKSGGRPSSE